ncbi:MAG: hypothetical protein R8K20_10460 [Gallionellaceae bacterium]
MAKFGNKSKQRLGECHPELQRLFKEVVKHYDCSILCGFRSEAKQEKAFNEKHSTKHFPHSRPNHFPSTAIDVVPYPIDWTDMERFRHFAGFVEATAIQLGVSVRSGGDWDSDREFDDQRFIDMPHFELIAA